MQPLPPLQTMLAAFARKDSRFDGVFYVAVKTTGVFCRPVCRAKPPKPANVEFFGSAEQALYHGYRACKLCRPLDAARRAPEVVERLMSCVESAPMRRLRGHDLVELGIDPSTARRQFRSYCGMTFAAYQRARRMGVALAQVRKGSPVTHAQVDAGFESPSGFRDAFARLFGTSASRSDGMAAALVSTWLPTPLGPMVAVASEHGVAMLEFADRKGLENAILKLRRRFGARAAPAAIVPGGHRHLDQLRRELSEYFEGTRRSFTVPLAPRGSAFEQRAWQYLQSIKYGRTCSYQDEATAIGHPSAVRAVGRANGCNNIAILIPCHRVIASSGELCGYGGGVARKRWLLDHERRYVESAVNRFPKRTAPLSLALG
jgi:AraC family transcriptional regulator, regulatory protein of adaptative response / methylated-DNA-[protein]-cysteine methyltransferase